MNLSIYAGQAISMAQASPFLINGFQANLFVIPRLITYLSEHVGACQFTLRREPPYTLTVKQGPHTVVIEFDEPLHVPHEMFGNIRNPFVKSEYLRVHIIHNGKPLDYFKHDVSSQTADEVFYEISYAIVPLFQNMVSDSKLMWNTLDRVATVLHSIKP